MDWVRGEKLGQGSFATVSLAFSRGGNPSLPPLMAVKSCGASLSSSLATEKSILQKLGSCPEIIRCFGGCFSFERGERLYNVLLEYAPGGSLADQVKNSGDHGLPEFEVRSHTKALLRGLTHIHTSGYVHCDIKLQNVLIGFDGASRIADFGLTRLAGGGPVGSQLRGTPMYMSPEMVVKGEQEPPADVWALGCAVAEMAGGGTAWEGFSDAAALMMRIGVGDEVPRVPGTLSDEGRDFLARCFAKDPRRRWTAEMLLNHPFVAGEDDWRKKGAAESDSPRCIFEFDHPEWVSGGHFGEDELWFTEEESSSKVAARLGELVCERGCDWSVSDEWVTVRLKPRRLKSFRKTNTSRVVLTGVCVMSSKLQRLFTRKLYHTSLKSSGEQEQS
ncbi:mitogen-activated protein kinase kinase kinase [Striga asiatica]|uniref:Mitogen-activated protein kinase kinase kinase n=1 Tax=Striga asiatica TaxID=4170 RepID=A0A5A7Q093_STRAF|nr:mitogen-activated protein kinase kinase kinase [Striga asiatica]